MENIDLVVFDFDGVLTDNRVLVFENGLEAVFCNRADGLGFDRLRQYNIPTLILSTERNKVVSCRAKKLGVACLHGIKDKKTTLIEYCRKRNFFLKNVVYVGNDLNDLDVMKIVGWPVCPSDAHDRIKKISRMKMKLKGGYGIVRELAENLSCFL